MGEKSTPSKNLCKKALESVQGELADLPNVVGLGVIRDKAGEGHRVALYVSKMPKGKKALSAFPSALKIPGSKEEVGTELVEIGEIKLEEQQGLGKKGHSLEDESPRLGKEPL